MAKRFKLDSPVRDFYGDREYTFRNKLDSGEMKIEKRNDFSTKFKDEYYARQGLMAWQMDGREIKKYFEAQQENTTKATTRAMEQELGSKRSD